MKRSPYFFLLVSAFLLSSTVVAHPGGHGIDPKSVKLWHFKNNKIAVAGVFLLNQKDTIFVQCSNGETIKFPVNSLSQEDKKIAEAEIASIESINSIHFQQFKAARGTFVTNDKYSEYALFIYILTVLFIGFFLFKQFRQFRIAKYRPFFASLIPVLLVSSILACKKNTETITSVVNTVTAAVNNPLSMDSAFTAYKPGVTTNWDNTYFYISSNGIPTHGMMVGITSWQQQVPVPQSYTGTNKWSIPLAPQYAANPISTATNLMKGAIAVAVNGIPIFNALNNRGDDAYLVGELDKWGGHCGKADDYHYHVAPLHLEATSGLKPIAYALDGFALYGSKEPDGSTMLALDSYHGHTWTNGVYHYHGTTSYPYTIGSMRGKVTLDPSTTAPENQIFPQALTTPIRPPLTPLTGAVITNFTPVGTNGYSLEYTIGTKKGYVNYNWTNAYKYTFTFIDINGVTTIQTY